MRTPPPRRRDDRQTLVEKIGVGVVTGLVVAGVTWAVWSLIDMPHEVELHEWIFRYHGWWPK